MFVDFTIRLPPLKRLFKILKVCLSTGILKYNRMYLMRNPVNELRLGSKPCIQAIKFPKKNLRSYLTTYFKRSFAATLPLKFRTVLSVQILTRNRLRIVLNALIMPITALGIWPSLPANNKRFIKLNK